MHKKENLALTERGRSMRAKFLLAVLLSASVLSGCFVATIETGLPASDVKIVNEWAHCFVYGLVPPKVVETASKCPSGVAKVVTQHSFLNGLVAGLTLNIYTPITIEVTCARPSEMGKLDEGETLTVPQNGSLKDFQNVFYEASDKAVQLDTEIFVRVEHPKS